MSWVAILEGVLKIVAWLIDRAKIKAEHKKNFLEWVKAASVDMKSEKLFEWGDKQLDYLKNTPWQETRNT